MRRLLPVFIAASVLLASCGQDDPPPASVAPVTAPASTPAAAATLAAAMTAEAVVKKLQQADLGLTNVAVQDEDSDPNNLLGRPNGYVSRASADMPGGDRAADKSSVDRGLVVETFADADAAKTRSEYIKGLQKASPMLGTEWHYMADQGRALVRVGGDVKPSLAKKVEAAVSSMTS